MRNPYNDDVDRLTGRDQPSPAGRVLTAVIFGCAFIALCSDTQRPAKAEAPPVITSMRNAAPKPTAKPKFSDKELKGQRCFPPEAPGLDYKELLLDQDVTPEEFKLLEVALYSCKRQVWRVADPVVMLALLRHESEMGVPPEARGITLATWCIEGAMRTQASDGGPLRGDYRDGVAMAHGPFQLWPWQREWCGLADGEADDPLVAASCYWKRVSDRREARAMNCENSWRVGEALASNGPKYLPYGCAAKSAHWAELERWTR